LPPRPWFHASYALDWSLALGVAGSGAAVALAAKPVTRPFHADDRRISLTHREDTVPEWSIAFAVAVPLAAAGLAQIWTRSAEDFHHAALGLAEGMALTFLLTNVLKASVGALRPDFLSRCQPDPQGDCTGDPDLVRKGRDSFPSGHASLFFAGGAYLSLYLWGKLQPFRTDGSLWKILLILSPLVAASLVGASRITDHRHHWEDVLAGAVLGTGFAYLGYRLHYPDPWSREAGTPRRRLRWVALPVVGPGHVGLAAQGEL
jgi:diacylglycerol diphosphate phosphatase/phosphatidate phosphatase